jgi:hypothetical protein
MGEDECGAGDAADLAGAGGDVALGAPDQLDDVTVEIDDADSKIQVFYE